MRNYISVKSIQAKPTISVIYKQLKCEELKEEDVLNVPEDYLVEYFDTNSIIKILRAISLGALKKFSEPLIPLATLYPLG